MPETGLFPALMRFEAEMLFAIAKGNFNSPAFAIGDDDLAGGQGEVGGEEEKDIFVCTRALRPDNYDFTGWTVMVC